MAERKYLDLSGLSTLWNSIKAKIPNKYASSKTEGGAADKAVSIPFAQVDSTSTSTAFTATVDGITELRDGVCVYLQNGVVTSASGCTLDINQLGAKPMYASNAAASGVAKVFASTYTMLFVYNSSRIEGGCWDMYYGYDSNSNTIGYQLRTNSTTFPMTQKVYRYRLLFSSVDGTKWVGANTSSSTNATALRTPNQTKINPFGTIVYYNSTTAVDINESPGATTLWSQYVITLGYSFNSTGAALTLDAFKPVYIKCAPQSDGSAIIDQTTPYVQTLPVAADGKIYIFLGIAVSATTVEMVPQHPVYYYGFNGIELWTGSVKQDAPLVGQIGSVIGDDYLTPENVKDAINSKRDVYLRYNDSTFGYLTFSAWNMAMNGIIVASNAVVKVNNDVYVYYLYGDTSNNSWIHDYEVVPTKLSDLNNDVGYITSSEAPVTSVNNQTGAVVISVPSNAGDVGAIAAPTNPSDGAILMYDYSTSSWVANVMAVWSGGNY